MIFFLPSPFAGPGHPSTGLCTTWHKDIIFLSEWWSLTLNHKCTVWLFQSQLYATSLNCKMKSTYVLEIAIVKCAEPCNVVIRLVLRAYKPITWMLSKSDISNHLNVTCLCSTWSYSATKSLQLSDWGRQLLDPVSPPPWRKPATLRLEEI